MLRNHVFSPHHTSKLVWIRLIEKVHSPEAPKSGLKTNSCFYLFFFLTFLESPPGEKSLKSVQILQISFSLRGSLREKSSIIYFKIIQILLLLYFV